MVITWEEYGQTFDWIVGLSTLKAPHLLLAYVIEKLVRFLFLEQDFIHVANSD